MLSDSAQKLKIFKPSSAHGARDALNSKEGKMMYKNPFGYSKYLALDAKHQKEAKILFGKFVPSAAKPPRVNSTKNGRNVDLKDKYI
jgi:hypothetical protein